MVRKVSVNWDWTHIKDIKDPIEVELPGGDPVFVVLRMERAKDTTSFTKLDDAPLDLRHSPAIKAM